MSISSSSSDEGIMYPGKRSAILAQLCMIIGTILWLIGSIFFVISQNRLSRQPYGAGGVFSGSSYNTAMILFIIGTAFWILGTFWNWISYIMHSRNNIIDVNGKRYHSELSRRLWLHSLLSFVGKVLILIGVAIALGKTLGTSSSGSILVLIGFMIWVIGLLLSLTPFLVTTNIHEIGILFVTAIGILLYIVGTIGWIERDAYGSMYVAALLYLLASSWLLFGYLAGLIARCRHYRGYWSRDDAIKYAGLEYLLSPGVVPTPLYAAPIGAGAATATGAGAATATGATTTRTTATMRNSPTAQLPS